MTTVRVGIFAVATVLAIFVVWYVLNNYGLRRNSYQIAIHFRTVVGLQPGSDVQLAGVNIGIVDEIRLIPNDQTASVICSINKGITVYKESIFTVTQTLTGAQSTLTIIPPPNLALATPMNRVLPPAEQPEGTVPPTIADLVSEGQKRMLDLDKTLAIVNKELPGIVKNFNGVAVHTNYLIIHADRNFNQLGQQLNGTIAGVNQIVGQLNGLLAVNGRSVSSMTANMQQLLQTSGPKIEGLITSLQATAANLNKTMASVESIATDPNLKTNLTSTAENLRESSEKLKAIATDIQSVTGDPKVQSQLRSTVQNLDETIAKANQILGNFTTAQGATGTPAPSGTQAPAGTYTPGPNSSPPGQTQMPHNTTSYRTGGHGFSVFDLATGEVRLNWGKQPSGPTSDVNFTVLPRFNTNLTLGVNDLGTTATYNFLVNRRGSPSLVYSLGVLRSQLGIKTVWNPGIFGARAELYNSRYPQLDLYGDIRLAQRLRFFYGEKAVMGPAANRTPQFGLQFGY